MLQSALLPAATTKDNVIIGVAAVAYYRRVDPVKSIVEIEDVEAAINQIAQTTVRNVVGRRLSPTAPSCPSEQSARRNEDDVVV